MFFCNGKLARNVCFGVTPGDAASWSMFFLPESPRFLQQSNEQRCRSSWRELFSGDFFLPLFVGLTLALCNQMSGINAYLQYAPQIFRTLGFSSHDHTMLGTLGLGAVNVVATMLAIYWVDLLGRRFLLIAGTFGMFFANTLLFSTSAFPWIGSPSLILLGLMIYIFSFAFGPGVVVWLTVVNCCRHIFEEKAWLCVFCKLFCGCSFEFFLFAFGRIF